MSFAYNLTNGLRTNMIDLSGTNSYQYDVLGVLTNKVVSWVNGPTIALSYGYDAFGSLTNLGSSSVNGVTNAYQYDLQGRLTNVLANGSVAAGNGFGSVAGYGYDAVGNLQSSAYGNGITNLYQYDAMNRLTHLTWKISNSSLSGTLMADFAYTLGPTGNRTALVETVNNTSRSYNWAYDPLYRLTQESVGGATVGTVNYTYDVVGNRTSRSSASSLALSAQSSTFTANDLLTSDGYDNDGNTTSSSSVPYQYDALDHLTTVNNGAIVIAYDGDLPSLVAVTTGLVITAANAETMSAVGIAALDSLLGAP